MLEIRNLTKSYRRSNTVLTNINLKIPTTGVTALVGDNGAGKTTLINCILRYIKYDEGEIILNGVPIAENIEDSRKLFFMPDLLNINLNVTVFDLAIYIAALKKDDEKKVIAKLHKAIDTLNLDFIDRKHKISKMSAGQKKKSFLALFLSLDVKFLILDEPTANLDVKTKNEFIEILELLVKNGIGVLITSHIIEELQQIADHLVIINNKKVAYQNAFDKNKEKISDIYEKVVPRQYKSLSDITGVINS